MVKRKKRKKDGLGYKTGHLPNVAGNEWHHIGKNMPGSTEASYDKGSKWARLEGGI